MSGARYLLSALTVGFAYLVSTAAMCGAGGQPPVPPTDVNAKIREIIADCRGGDFSQLPSKSGGGKTLGQGLHCPDTEINELAKPSCQRSFTVTVEVERMGELDCRATVSLETTSNQSVDHDHQTECDESGTCASSYVHWLAVINAEVTAKCNISVNGTPYPVDVSGEISGYNKNWTFWEMTSHQGERTCGPADPPIEPGDCKEMSGFLDPVCEKVE